jgi:hypothetical protein
MFAKFLVAPVLALGIACLAAPVVAQQSMNSMAGCTPEAMHAAVSKMAASMSSMPTSGDMDKDYAHAMMMMAKGQRDLSSWEMKCGKDSKTMGMAKDSMHHSDSEYKAWGGIFGGG